MEDVFETLANYKPETPKDDFGIIKGTFNCRFNYFRVEKYEGEVTELQGTEIVKYELEVLDAGDNLGRRLWKRFYIGSQKVDKKGKSDVQKLADVLFTLGFEFKNREELEKALEEVCNMTATVKAWGWKPDPEKDAIQQHTIKGQGSSFMDEPKSDNVPF